MRHEAEFLWLFSQRKPTIEYSNSGDYIKWKDAELVIYLIFWNWIRAKLQGPYWNWGVFTTIAQEIDVFMEAFQEKVFST